MVSTKSKLAPAARLKAALPPLLLAVMVLIYIGGIMAVHIAYFSHFRYGFDLAFYNQAAWNTINGRVLEVSATDFSSSLLGTDALFIVVLMTPFYAVVQSPLTLLAVETTVVAIGAVPVYWFARDKLGNRWFGLGFAFVYLMSLVVQNANLYELRFRPMATTFLLFAFYFYDKGRFRLWLLFAVLTLMCRPENGLLLVMLGVYGFVSGLHNKQNQGKRFVFGPVILGAIWFALAVWIIIPGSSSGGTIALGDNYPGGSPQAALFQAITNPSQGLPALLPDNALAGKLAYLPLLLLPFLFLPLGSPTVLLMMLPPVALNLLSKRPIQWNPFDYHYQGSVVPWLLFGTILTVQKLANSPRLLNHARSTVIVAVLLGVVLVATLGVYITQKNRVIESLRLRDPARLEAGKALLAQIPPDAPLAISNVWAAHVPPRRSLYFLGERSLYSLHPAQNARYVFADLQRDRDATPPNLSENALVEKILQDKSWRVLAEDNGYVVLVKSP